MLEHHSLPFRIFVYFGLAIGAIFLVLAVLGALDALAEEHFHPPEHAQLHETFYQNWMRPDNPTLSCCNKKDCYPTITKFENGKWYAQRRQDGQFIPVPSERIEKFRDSPDGQSHLCAPPPHASTEIAYCLVLGFGM